MAGECGLDKAVGGMTGTFIELSFAALGAGLMGLAFDVKTKAHLELKVKNGFERLKSITKEEELYQQEFVQLGKDLDSLSTAEKVKRFRNLSKLSAKIFNQRLDAEEELEKWL